MQSLSLLGFDSNALFEVGLQETPIKKSVNHQISQAYILDPNSGTSKSKIISWDR